MQQHLSAAVDFTVHTSLGLVKNEMQAMGREHYSWVVCVCVCIEAGVEGCIENTMYCTQTYCKQRFQCGGVDDESIS